MSCFPAAVRARTDGSDVATPSRVRVLLGRVPARPAPQREPWLRVERTKSQNYALLSARVTNAVNLSPADFEAYTAHAYGVIAQELEPLKARYPVRFWNHIPCIHAAMDEGRDRYMVFNAGRFRAFVNWFGGADKFASRVATASGVGHRGSDLVVHCLAANQPGVAVENPRQVPPYRYSKRFGPLPPCFSRATVVPNSNLILIGGTASIRGEESVHLTSLADQTRETLENLRTLMHSAAAAVQRKIDCDPLQLFRELRIYHPLAPDAAPLKELLHPAFPQLGEMEFLQADLCRSELVVEIEGTAAW